MSTGGVQGAGVVAGMEEGSGASVGLRLTGSCPVAGSFSWSEDDLLRLALLGILVAVITQSSSSPVCRGRLFCNMLGTLSPLSAVLACCTGIRFATLQTDWPWPPLLIVRLLVCRAVHASVGTFLHA